MLGPSTKDEDDELYNAGMFKINNSPDCVCVAKSLCDAGQSTRLVKMFHQN